MPLNACVTLKVQQRSMPYKYKASDFQTHLQKKIIRLSKVHDIVYHRVRKAFKDYSWRSEEIKNFRVRKLNCCVLFMCEIKYYLPKRKPVSQPQVNNGR